MKDDANGDYRVGHRAPTDDGYSASIDRLTQVFPADVYEHPEYVGSGEVDDETMAQLLKAKDNPDATVRIYRALPPGLDEINVADWVTLSEAYARQHAIQDDDEANDWPIIHADVPVRTVFADGNDLAEFGYDGPALTGLGDTGAGEGSPTGTEPGPSIAPPKPGIWENRDVHFHAAHRAIIAGTARQELAADFASSGLDYDALAEKVGHSPRTARRVIEGKEFLTETALAVYFKALGHRPAAEDIETYRLEQETL